MGGIQGVAGKGAEGLLRTVVIDADRPVDGLVLHDGLVDVEAHIGALDHLGRHIVIAELGPVVVDVEAVADPLVVQLNPGIVDVVPGGLPVLVVVLEDFRGIDGVVSPVAAVLDYGPAAVSSVLVVDPGTAASLACVKLHGAPVVAIGFAASPRYAGGIVTTEVDGVATPRRGSGPVPGAIPAADTAHPNLAAFIHHRIDGVGLRPCGGTGQESSLVDSVVDGIPPAQSRGHPRIVDGLVGTPGFAGHGHRMGAIPYHGHIANGRRGIRVAVLHPHQGAVLVIGLAIGGGTGPLGNEGLADRRIVGQQAAVGEGELTLARAGDIVQRPTDGGIVVVIRRAGVGHVGGLARVRQRLVAGVVDVVGGIAGLVLGVLHIGQIPVLAHVFAEGTGGHRTGHHPGTILGQILGHTLADHPQHIGFRPHGHADPLVFPAGDIQVDDFLALGGLVPIRRPRTHRGVAIDDLILQQAIDSGGKVIQLLVTQLGDHQIPLGVRQLVEGPGQTRGGQGRGHHTGIPHNDLSSGGFVSVVTIIHALDEVFALGLGRAVPVAILAQGHIHGGVVIAGLHRLQPHLFGHRGGDPGDDRHLDDLVKHLVIAGHHLDGDGLVADDGRGSQLGAAGQTGGSIHHHVSTGEQIEVAVRLEGTAAQHPDGTCPQLAAGQGSQGRRVGQT